MQAAYTTIENANVKATLLALTHPVGGRVVGCDESPSLGVAGASPGAAANAVHADAARPGAQAEPRVEALALMEGVCAVLLQQLTTAAAAATSGEEGKAGATLADFATALEINK